MFLRCSVLFLGLMIAGWGCTGEQKPIYTDEIFITEYPKLAEAITDREADILLNFIDHQNEHVRSLAWRALSKSEIENQSQFFDTVISKNEAEGWIALSYVSLQPDQINRIEELLTGNPSEYSGSCEVFRRQGGSEHALRLLLLLRHINDKERCATAVGTLISREKIPKTQVRQIIESAFNPEISSVRKQLLYGLYRNSINRPAKGSDLYELLKNRWAEAGIGMESALDQFMIRILGEEGANLFLNETGRVINSDDLQLVIEFVRSVRIQNQITDQLRDLISELLAHKNPHVVVQTLERLIENHISDEHLIGYIYNRIAIPTRNHEIFLTSLEYLQQQGTDISNLSEKIAFTERKNHYLTDRVLSIYMKMEPNDRSMQRLAAHVETGGVRGMHAMRTLTNFWLENDDDKDSAKIHQIVKKAVESLDPGVISALNTLLTDESLVSEDDFEWIYSAYSDAAQENIYDVIDSLEQILETRFPERFEGLTDKREPNFRIPDWDRLYALGTRPHWRLETDKGVIEIRLNPLSAPFTVSAIDSLIRAGSYDDVAFHRVVRNFVVQGGDFVRKDGLGSPDFTLPTEPSSLRSFTRGAAGIASSGTDTEGSQYFFMHQWAPHLDGDYTLFGQVVRGMDVVDRLQIGDKVTRASISVR